MKYLVNIRQKLINYILTFSIMTSKRQRKEENTSSLSFALRLCLFVLSLPLPPFPLSPLPFSPSFSLLLTLSDLNSNGEMTPEGKRKEVKLLEVCLFLLPFVSVSHSPSSLFLFLSFAPPRLSLSLSDFSSNGEMTPERKDNVQKKNY